MRKCQLLCDGYLTGRFLRVFASGLMFVVSYPIDVLSQGNPVPATASQATAAQPFSEEQLAHLLRLARKGIGELVELQKQALQ